MIDIDTSDRKEQRKFGIVVGIAFGLLGVLRWAFHGFDMDSLPTILWSICGVLVFFGVVAPALLKPVFIAWIKFAEIMNFVMTRVFLTITFYLILTPVGLYSRITGDDPLKRKMLPEGETYWEAPDEPHGEGLDSWKNQF